MSLFRSIDEMEESWQDVAPEKTSSTTDGAVGTGEQAYLRTQEILKEAQAVSDMLFDDEADMARRRQRAYAREEALDAADAASQTAWPTRSSSTLFKSTLVPEEAKDSGAAMGGFGGVLLAAGPAKGLGKEADERRPEERRCCDAFFKLQGLLKSLSPGARVRPREIAEVLRYLSKISDDAQSAAAVTTGRLRELQGGGSPAVAVAAATAHELSLEKDTWALLLYLNEAEDFDMVNAAEIRDNPSLAYPAGTNDSDEEVLEVMWRRDWLYRRTHAVVKWLQQAANAQLEARAPAAFEPRAWPEAGWTRTLESLVTGIGQKSEIAHIHPDANIKKLSHTDDGGRAAGRRSAAAAAAGDAVKVLNLTGQDDLDEEELVRTLWKLIRAGKLKSAKALCVDRGQPWRAAAMAGGGVVGLRQEEDHGVEDGAVYSPCQGLWQDTCWQLSVSMEKGIGHSKGPARSVAEHEAAVFAHLAGNSQLLLGSELTQSWEDQAWVRFCSLLHRKVLDARIKQRHAQAALSSRFPGVSYLTTDEQLLERMEQTNPPSNHEAVFEVLDDSSHARVRAEGKGVYRQAQQALILGEENIPLFLENILRRVADCGDGESAEGEQGHGGPGTFGRPSSSSQSQSQSQPPPPFRSPQLLRFAAHLALVLAAQCPYLTMKDDTQEAIEDVVCAYAEHLANTRQTNLVAVYAAMLPISRRRELYARFLRSLEGEANRREGLEQAKKHMAEDVPAILKRVVEYVRVETPSVAPRVPRKIPDGDLKKIRAMSWLLNEPETCIEAVMQANAVARHLVLQTYQTSAIGSRTSFGSAPTSTLPWDRPTNGRTSTDDDENASDDHGTPVILSARAEAIEMLLKDVPTARAAQGVSSAADDDVSRGSVEGGGLHSSAALAGEKEEEETGRARPAAAVKTVSVSADIAREQLCWRLLLEARRAYSEWASTRRAREQVDTGRGIGGGARGRGRDRVGVDEDENEWALVEAADADSNGEEDLAAVDSAAENAIAAAERVLTFEDGWMYPQDPSSAGDYSENTNSTSQALVLADAQEQRQASNVPGGGVVTYPLPAEQEGTERDMEEKVKANEVAEARKLRATWESERIVKAEEVATRLEENGRREELLKVREACLPGLVLLFHEVVHSTGLWMLQWGNAEEARGWFVRGQRLATMVANDVHRIAEAMSRAQTRRLLQCIERSTTKVLECDERRNV